MSALRGTGSLVRLALRRDRIRLSVWVIALVGVTAGSAKAVASTYDTPAEVASYARNFGDSPATVAVSGPPYGLDQIGGIVVYETSVLVLIGVALLAAFTVVRHTRAEEEVGRTELVASAAVGRHAGTAAALVVALAASLLVGLGVALSVLSADFPDRRCPVVRRLGRRSRGLLRRRRDIGLPADVARPDCQRSHSGRARRRLRPPGDR